MSSSWDCVVLGLGGVGSAALFHLARRGAKVLGLEQHHLVHDLGSSHGQTRVIRLAYYEHPDYVPLLRRSYALWAELEAEAGRQLYVPCGVLQVGPTDGEVVPGVLASAAAHGLAVERLDRAAVASRFSGYAMPDGYAAVFEAEAGLLLVEDCVRAHLERARAMGAEVRAEERVFGLRREGEGVVLESSGGPIRAGAVVVAAGAGSAALLADLRLPLELKRKTQFWFAHTGPSYAAARGAPAFLYELPEGVFYGLPYLDDRGVKVAQHSGGETIARPLDPAERPASVGSGFRPPPTLPPSWRSTGPEELHAVEVFRRAWLPELAGPLRESSPCMYTMTPDAHFIVDRHPEIPSLAFAAGLSGHGFKLTPALGEALAELALGSGTRLPVDFLSAGRFASKRAG